jgi:CDP-diacylglycerol--serine O-phosphatidyltransferase
MKKEIPNLLTLGNLFCGFLAINATINGNIRNAAILIFIAIMLDAMDGRLARILGVSNDFGKQLDSLADIVSFGVVPAFMASYVYFEGEYLGIILSGLFPLFGAYRLARFNITPTDQSLKYFKGIPITLAGAVVTFLTLFEKDIPDYLFIAIYITLALLMVSTVKIPSMKKIKLPKNAFITTIFILYMGYVFLIVKAESVPISFFIALAVYIVFIVIRFIKEKEPKKIFKKPIRMKPLNIKRFKRKKV